MYKDMICGNIQTIELDSEWLKNNNQLIKNNPDVGLYAGDLHASINNDLRSFSINPINLTITKEIVKLLDQAEAYPTELCLYRGVAKDFANILTSNIIGDELILKGFTSMTVDLDIAQGFATLDGAILIVCFSSNTKFLYIGPQFNQDEGEVLSYPNMHVKLKEIHRAPGKYTVYVFEMCIYEAIELEYIHRPLNYDSEDNILATVALPQKYVELLPAQFIERAIEDGLAYNLFAKKDLTEEMAIYMIKKGYPLKQIPKEIKSYKTYLEAVRYNNRNLRLVPIEYSETIKKELSL